MWNEHWSWGATERVNVMAPSDEHRTGTRKTKRCADYPCTLRHDGFLRSTPPRAARSWNSHTADPPPEREMPDPPQPVDASDGGSDTGEAESYKAWHRQHPVIEIDDADAISDDGQEVYNLLHHKGIKNLIFMGVHTNMCVLGRSFAIKTDGPLGLQRCACTRPHRCHVQSL